MKQVLITGGAGFIGINLVNHLLETQCFKIIVVDDLSSGNYQGLKQVVKRNGGDIETQLSPTPDNVCFYQLDILNKENLLKVLKGCDQVVHLAAQTAVIASREDPFYDARLNITGTLNLLDGSVKSSVQRFIFASSAAALGEQDPPLHEKKIPQPASPYGAAKLAGEAYCSAFYHSYGLETAALRFANVYGPHSYHKGSVVAQFMKRILGNQPLVVYGDGEQTRDFLYVEDIARVIRDILETDRNNIKGEIFQVGTGRETSVNTLISSLSEITAVTPKIVYEPERKGEIKRNVTSIEKIKKKLGFEPHFDLERGLGLTWKWFREQ